MKPKYMRTKYKYKINWDMLGAMLMSIFCWTVIIVLLFHALGCTQVILTKDQLKINTFLKSTEFDNATFDASDGSFDVNKYKGLPSDVEVVYDPATHTFKFRAKAIK